MTSDHHGAMDAGVYIAAFPDIKKAEVGATQARLFFANERDTVVEWADARLEAPVRALFNTGLGIAAWEAACEDAAMADAAGRLMDYLVQCRLLVWWYGTPEQRMIEVMPLRGTVDFRRPAGDIAGFTLSDMAVLTYRDGRPIIVHPEIDAVVKIAPAGYALLPGVLAHGRPEAAEAPQLPEPAGRMLASCGFLSDPADAPPARAHWSTEEWLFHRRTRTESQLDHLAVTGVGEITDVPPPNRAPPTHAIQLPRDENRDTGKSALLAIMDARRSYRIPGPDPLPLEALAGVLWRVARNRTDRYPWGSNFAVRNLPGGGGLGEIEYYVAVNRCDGLARGFYFYDGYDHALAPVAGPGPWLDRYLDTVAVRMSEDSKNPQRPDCLIVLSTKQARLAKKYRGMSYRLTLLHVGVAYEALYLAATELGLSPCAIGTSDIGLFQALTGREPHEETSVGEFALSGPRTNA